MSFVTLTLGLNSCTKKDTTTVSPTPTGYANVYVSNYYTSGSYLYVTLKNSGTATAYSVSVKIYTHDDYGDYNTNYLTTTSIAPGGTSSGYLDCSWYYPYTFYYTIYTPTWN